MTGPRVRKAQRDAIRETERRTDLALRIRRIGRGHRDPVAFYRDGVESPIAIGTVAAIETDQIVLSNFGRPDGTGTRIPWTGLDRVEPPPVEKATCDDCQEVWPVDDLVEPVNLAQRLDPGGVVPAGECPSCGALAYLNPKPAPESLPDDPTIEQLATLELPDPSVSFDYQDAVEARFARIAEVARHGTKADQEQAAAEQTSIGGGRLIAYMDLTPFTTDLDGEWPQSTLPIFDLKDGEVFVDKLAREFRRVGYGPVQGSIEIAACGPDDFRAYIDGGLRVRRAG